MGVCALPDMTIMTKQKFGLKLITKKVFLHNQLKLKCLPNAEAHHWGTPAFSKHSVCNNTRGFRYILLVFVKHIQGLL